jgi:hypothetical protein
MPTVPPAPSGLQVVSLSKGSTTGAEYVNLSWTVNSTTDTQILLQQSINSTSNFQTVQTLGGTTSSVSQNIGTSPTAGTYYYRVIGVNSVGQSPASNTASRPIRAIIAVPAAPTNLAATGTTKNSAGQLFIGLKWQNNATNATSLEILQSINSTSNFQVIKTPATSFTSYSINIGAAPTHGTYYYEVVAVNSAGASSPSNVLGFVIN